MKQFHTAVSTIAALTRHRRCMAGAMVKLARERAPKNATVPELAELVQQDLAFARDQFYDIITITRSSGDVQKWGAAVGKIQDGAAQLTSFMKTMHDIRKEQVELETKLNEARAAAAAPAAVGEIPFRPTDFAERDRQIQKMIDKLMTPDPADDGTRDTQLQKFRF